MKTSTQKIPLSERAVVQRINRKLAKENEALRTSRQNSRAQSIVGNYYIVDLNRNAVTASQIDLEALARELGVIMDYECVDAD
jgi:hypothetical protein